MFCKVTLSFADTQVLRAHCYVITPLWKENTLSRGLKWQRIRKKTDSYGMAELIRLDFVTDDRVKKRPSVFLSGISYERVGNSCRFLSSFCRLFAVIYTGKTCIDIFVKVNYFAKILLFLWICKYFLYI